MRELNMAEIQTVSGGLIHPHMFRYVALGVVGIISAVIATGVLFGCYSAYEFTYRNE